MPDRCLQIGVYTTHDREGHLPSVPQIGVGRSTHGPFSEQTKAPEASRNHGWRGLQDDHHQLSSHDNYRPFPGVT